MIAFYIGSSERVIDECQERGWTRIAYQRFVTGNEHDKHDIRAIWRIADLAPFAGKTLFIKGREYDDGPENASDDQLDRWIKEQARFEAFIASGAGEWVEAP